MENSLYLEACKALAERKLTAKDIRFVKICKGDSDTAFRCTWKAFSAAAKRARGFAKFYPLFSDIEIVGKNWRLELYQDEYEGVTEFQFRKFPIPPKRKKTVVRIKDLTL